MESYSTLVYVQNTIDMNKRTFRPRNDAGWFVTPGDRHLFVSQRQKDESLLHLPLHFDSAGNFSIDWEHVTNKLEVGKVADIIGEKSVSLFHALGRSVTLDDMKRFNAITKDVCDNIPKQLQRGLSKYKDIINDFTALEKKLEQNPLVCPDIMDIARVQAKRKIFPDRELTDEERKTVGDIELYDFFKLAEQQKPLNMKFFDGLVQRVQRVQSFPRSAPKQEESLTR